MIKTAIYKTYIVSLLTISLLLIACATATAPGTTGPGESPSFNTSLALGYSSVTQIRQTTTTLLKAGKLSSGDAQNIQDQADLARQGLDIANSLSKVDTKTASGKLDATSTILKALTVYLATRQGGG